MVLKQIGGGTDDSSPWTLRRDDGTPTASDGDFIICDGGTVTLPTPQQGAAVAVGNIEQITTITASAGQVEFIPKVKIDNPEPVVFVSDGSDWFVANDLDYAGVIPDTLIDTFEDESNGGQYGSSQSLSDFYGGDLTAFTRQTTTALEGNKSLEGTSDGPSQIISSTSGLNRYPDQGDSWEFLVEPTASKQFSGMLFGTQDETNTPGGYFVRVDARGGIDINRFDGSGNKTKLKSASASWDLDATNRVEIDWSTNNDITARAYDSTDSKTGTVTATDSTYTDGGVGWLMNENTGGTSSFYFDGAQII